MTPYFIWDYDLSEEQIRKILHGENEIEKLWITTRIITHAKFEDVWKYLTAQDIVKVLPRLRLSSKTRQDWERALRIWGYHV
jgi:hypothetical protein